MVGGPEALVQGDRPLDVGRALHVHPEPRAGGVGPFGEPGHVPEAGLLIDVEAELGGLHRELDRTLEGRSPVDDRVVVRGHVVRLGEGDEVLPEAREEDSLPRGGQRGGCREGGIRVLAGHEAADGLANESEARDALLEPGVAGHPEQERAHGTGFSSIAACRPDGVTIDWPHERRMGALG